MASWDHFDADWDDGPEGFAEFADDGWTGDEGLLESNRLWSLNDALDGGGDELEQAYNDGWNDREDAPSTHELLMDGLELEDGPGEFAHIWREDAAEVHDRLEWYAEHGGLHAADELPDRYIENAPEDGEPFGDMGDAIRHYSDGDPDWGVPDDVLADPDWEISGRDQGIFYDLKDTEGKDFDFHGGPYGTWDDFTDDERAIADEEAQREAFADSMREVMEEQREDDDSYAATDAEDDAPNDRDEDKEDRDNLGGTKGLFG